jgi:hypothetical protein
VSANWIGRRNLLRALGLGAGAMFLPSLGRKSQAGGDTPIRRLVILTSQHQVVGDAWQMLRGHADKTAFEYAFDDPDPESFSEILRPLHPYREKLIVLDGLAYLSGAWNAAGVGNAHNVSHLTALTGIEPTSNNNAGGPSIDQIIAGHVAVPGRIPSLELATGTPWLGGYVNLGAAARAPVEVSPADAFARLFPADSEVPAEPTSDDLVRLQRANVLDFVAAEYNQINGNRSGRLISGVRNHTGPGIDPRS